MAESDEHEGRQRSYPAEQVRQGEIILRTRTWRIIFVGGLVGLVLLAVILRPLAG
ncbi:MAG: peptide ABC transporter permease [Alphaproteobacteria bacterium]